MNSFVVNRRYTVRCIPDPEEDKKAINELVRIQREYEEEHPEVLNEINHMALETDSLILSKLLTSSGIPTTLEEAKESLTKKHYDEICCISKPNSVTMFIEDRKSKPKSYFL